MTNVLVQTVTIASSSLWFAIVRGVNIGGWLIVEPWITPSLFDNTGNDSIIDEWTFGQYQDEVTARSVLQNHWDSFYTESDFAAIAAAGCVLVSFASL